MNRAAAGAVLLLAACTQVTELFPDSAADGGGDAAADAGDDGEEDEGHQGLLFLGRQQRPGNREHGDADIVEEDEGIGRDSGRGHGLISHREATGVKGRP